MISPPPSTAPRTDPDAVLRRVLGRGSCMTEITSRVETSPDEPGAGTDAGAFDGKGEFDWHELVRYAGHHLVPCSLARRLLESGRATSVPEEALEALAMILEANRRRNAMLREACTRFVTILVDAGISPVALKGIGMIMEGRYAEPGERIASDIDLWIPEASLPVALEALRAAGAEQVVNPYLPARRNLDPAYRRLDPGDFRNDPAYAFYHVPAIKLEAYLVHLELHIGLSHGRTALERWLEAAVLDDARELGDTGLRLPSLAFRLLQNFHHSQLKDGLGKLGRLDWRHLLDAARLLEDEGAGKAISDARRVAEETGTAAELALHVHQLDKWLGVKVENVPLDAAARARIARFEAVRGSSLRSGYARWVKRWRTRARDLVSPRRLRHYYGPVPWHEAYGNAARYRLGGALERYRSR